VPGISSRRHTGGLTPRSVTLSWMMFVWALVFGTLVLAINLHTRPVAWVPVADIDDGAALFRPLCATVRYGKQPIS